MYESPINIIMSDIQMSFDGEIYKAVQRAGIDVRKEELLKALKYDRNQYQKGYNDRDSEIIRCKDCKHFNDTGCSPGYGWCERSGMNRGVTDEWYCADGKRR